MIQDKLQIFLQLSNGMAALYMLAYVGGFYVCLANRKVSSRLIVVAIGFAGLFGSVGISRVAVILMDDVMYQMYGFSIVASVIGCISTVVLVFGLGATLVDIRRQLSLAMDPNYARR